MRWKIGKDEKGKEIEPNGGWKRHGTIAAMKTLYGEY